MRHQFFITAQWFCDNFVDFFLMSNGTFHLWLYFCKDSNGLEKRNSFFELKSGSNVLALKIDKFLKIARTQKLKVVKMNSMSQSKHRHFLQITRTQIKDCWHLNPFQFSKPLGTNAFWGRKKNPTPRNNRGFPSFSPLSEASRLFSLSPKFGPF